MTPRISPGGGGGGAIAPRRPPEWSRAPPDPQIWPNQPPERLRSASGGSAAPSGCLRSTPRVAKMVKNGPQSLKNEAPAWTGAQFSYFGKIAALNYFGLQTKPHGSFQGPILEPWTSQIAKNDPKSGPQAPTRGSLTRHFAPMVGDLSIMMGSVPSFMPKRVPQGAQIALTDPKLPQKACPNEANVGIIS